MLVRVLRIKNYRRIRDATIEFGKGLIAIIGENGAGKTTIIEALLWSLFGSDAGETLRGDKTSLRSDSAPPNEVVSVALEFEMEGKPYVVERSMSAKGLADAKISTGGMLLARGSDDVTNKVRAILGMDWSSFRKSIYSPQKELDSLSDMQPKKREEFISRLLGIDVLDKVVIPGIRRKANEIEFEMKTVQGQIQDFSEEGMQAKLKEVDERLRGHESEKAGSIEKMGGMEKRYNERKKALEKMARAKDEHERLTRVLIEANGRKERMYAIIQKDKDKLAEIDRWEQELRGMKGVEEEHDRTEEMVDSLEKARDSQQAIMDLQRSVDDLSLRLQKITENAQAYAGLDEEVKRIGEVRSKLESERKECTTEKNKASSELNECKKRKVEIKRHMDQISKLGSEGECPTCGRRLEDHYEHLMRNWERDMKGLEDRTRAAERADREADLRAADIKKREDALKKKEDAISKKKWDIQRLREEGKEVRSDLDAKSAGLQKLSEDIKASGMPKFDQERYDALRANLKALRDRNQRVKTLRVMCSKRPEIEREVVARDAELSKVRTEIEGIERSLKELDFDQETYDTLKVEVDSEKGVIDHLKEEVHELDKKIVIYKKDKEVLEVDLRKLSSLREKSKVLMQGLEVMRALDGQMVLFWKYLIARIRPSISDYTSMLLADVSDYARVELDEEYNLLIYRDGVPRPIKQFSGGEQDLMNLCLRLALSRIICERRNSDINIIILDEVFGSLDGARRSSLLAALDSLSSKFAQVILITHVDDIKEWVGSHIIVRRSGETSVVEVG